MIFLALFFIFLVGWIFFWSVLHLVVGSHLLLALAIIFLIVHFVHRRRTI
jgi:hypothetical protein